MKTRFAVAGFLVLIITFLAFSQGCSKSPKQPPKNKLVIWHWMIDRKDAFASLAQRYKEKNGIDVEFKLLFPPGTYSMKVTAAARAKTLPDIFGILGEKETVATFIRAKHIANLTTYMDENGAKWKNSFYPHALSVTTFKATNTSRVDAGIYAAPIDTTIMQFVYNKKILKELGFDKPPESFKEFLDYAQKAKSQLNIIGFISGWGEGWLLNALATEWAINLMGEDKFLKTIKGDVSYTDADWLKVFSLFATLKDTGILAPNIATMTNKEAEDAFAKGKSLFSFNGSWSVNVYKQLNPDLEYAFFPLPRASDIYPVKIWGGAGASFMVNANSANKEEAVKFLKWLTEKEQQAFLIKETNNLPSVLGNEKVLPNILKPMAQNFSSLTHPNIWPYNENSRVIESMNKGLQQIVQGLKTPEEVAKEIQEKKNKVLKR